MNDLHEKKYSIIICGQPITYSFHYPETKGYFEHYITEFEGSECDIRLSEDLINESIWIVDDSEENGYREFQILMLATGNYLLPYGCALIHGVSFIRHGLAWILTAPSGTGKSTQLFNWIKLYAGQTKVINGDKTGIECRKDGTVYAHSSPWHGKEGIGSAGMCAKLGGIIVLEQGSVNSMYRIEPCDSVYPLFIELISYPETEQQVFDLRDILDHLIGAVPVWKFVNQGDARSTMLLHDTLLSFLCSYDVTPYTGKENVRLEDRV